MRRRNLLNGCRAATGSFPRPSDFPPEKIEKSKTTPPLYSGLPFEKMMLKAIQDVYTEQIPDSYTVLKADKRFEAYKEIRIALKRVVDVEGEGLRIKEYLVSLER